jgi:hypothetical protein
VTCAAGLVCQEESEGPQKICQVPCTKASQCTALGSACLAPASGGTQKACTTSCNPLAATGCPTGTACHVFGNGSTGIGTYCDGAGPGTQSVSCTQNNECAAGYVCVTDPFGSGDCEFMCDYDAANPICPPGYTCTDLFRQLGSTEYGTCE